MFGNIGISLDNATSCQISNYDMLTLSFSISPVLMRLCLSSHSKKFFFLLRHVCGKQSSHTQLSATFRLRMKLGGNLVEAVQETHETIELFNSHQICV